MNINDLMGSFSEKQLREINKFVNSAQGQKLSRSLSATDKERIKQQFAGLDPNFVLSKLQGLSDDDIKHILR